MAGARTVVGAAALTALGASWEVTRRRDLAQLQRDPHRDILTAVPPGRPTAVTTDDGTRLHARVTDATAEPRAAIVFAHGWGMGLRFWMHQLRHFADDHLVVAYDQRGHGASGQVGSDGFTIEALGRDLATVVDTFVPRELPTVVVGHSLGGMSIVSSARVEQTREHVDAAVLVDTGLGDLVRGMFRGLGVVETAASTLGPRALRARLPVPKRTTPLSARAVRAVALNPQAPPSAVALTEQLFLDCPVDARAGVGQALADLDLSDVVGEWKAPTTVVVGARDRMTPPHHARRLVRELPDAELVTVDGAGHQSPVERPEVITRVIEDRVRGLIS